MALVGDAWSTLSYWVDNSDTADGMGASSVNLQYDLTKGEIIFPVDEAGTYAIDSGATAYRDGQTGEVSFYGSIFSVRSNGPVAANAPYFNFRTTRPRKQLSPGERIKLLFQVRGNTNRLELVTEVGGIVVGREFISDFQSKKAPYAMTFQSEVRPLGPGTVRLIANGAIESPRQSFIVGRIR